MLFDKICGLADRDRREPSALRYVVQNARLFILNDASLAAIDRLKQPTPEHYNLFTLPFPIVALETGDKVIFLSDLEDQQVGVSGQRKFMVAIPLSDHDQQGVAAMLPPNKRAFKNCMNVFEGSFVVTGFTPAAPGLPLQIAITISDISDLVVVDGDAFPSSDLTGKPTPQETAQGITNLLASCMRILITLSSPDLFILEESPAKAPKTKAGRMARSHQRPQYTVLKPKAIREKLGLSHGESTGNGPSKRPHERRAHLRRLTVASGYKKDRIIQVKACWIGESEARIGNKIYKVILDK